MAKEIHFWSRSPASRQDTLFDEKKVVHNLFDEELADPFKGDTDVNKLHDDSFFEALTAPKEFLDLTSPVTGSEERDTVSSLPTTAQVNKPQHDRSASAAAYLASLNVEEPADSSEEPADTTSEEPVDTTSEKTEKTTVEASNESVKVPTIESTPAAAAPAPAAAKKTVTMSDAEPTTMPPAPPVEVTQVALKDESSDPPAPRATTDLDKYKNADSNVDLWCTSSSAMKEKSQIPAATLQRMSLMKNVLGQKIDRRKKDKKEETDRQDKLEDKMTALGLSDEAKQQARLELKQEELRIRFHQSKRLGVQDFESLALLGRGAFGEVHLVRMKPSNEIMAMKSMDKRSTVMKNQVQHVHSEKNVLAESDSGWIVSLHASFQDKHMLHLLMDFMPGGDLMELLIKYDIFTETATKQYISELMVALKHVHTLGYIHRDIKPDNLLIDARGHIKLTDLGLCKKLGDIETEGIKPAEFNPDDDPDDEGAAPARKARHIPQAFSVVGTPDYIAPEVLLQEGYGAESDMWSMGVIMFECLLGYTPFHGDNPLTITRKIVNWRTVLRFPRSRIKNLSPECMHFMRSLICDAPDRLGKQGGIGEIQKHPWLTGVKWDSLREQPAPYKPVIADCWEELIDEIKPLPLDSPRFKEIVEKITSHFPDAGNHIAPALFQGKRQPQHKDQNFMGFEYRRKPKVQHALLDD